MSDAGALRDAADFIEATCSLGAIRNDYTDGWYHGISYALAELRRRADEAEASP